MLKKIKQKYINKESTFHSHLENSDLWKYVWLEIEGYLELQDFLGRRNTVFVPGQTISRTTAVHVKESFSDEDQKKTRKKQKKNKIAKNE